MLTNRGFPRRYPGFSGDRGVEARSNSVSGGKQADAAINLPVQPVSNHPAMSRPIRGIHKLNAPPSLSPSLAAPGETGPFEAHEVKFLVDPATVKRLEKLANGALNRDLGDPALSANAYRVRTVYPDTIAGDVYWRQSGFRASKFRLRLYGLDGPRFVERKIKRGTQVSKQRTEILGREPAWLVSGEAPPECNWFASAIRERRLDPVCSVTCLRNAWFGSAEGLRFRMTVDRDLGVAPVDRWQFPGLDRYQGVELPGLICEFKFRGALPRLFREWVAQLGLTAAPFSKFRKAIESLGLVRMPNAISPMPHDVSANRNGIHCLESLHDA
jgi:VTC domain